MIADVLDEYLTEKWRQENVAGNGWDKFRVHEAGKCPLNRYLKRLDPDKMISPPTPALLRIFQIGHEIHNWIQQEAENTGHVPGLEGKYEVLGIESPVHDEHRTGHIDLVVSDEEGRVILIDIKTVNGRLMEKYRESPPKNYIHQVATYCDMWVCPVDDAYLLWVPKDTMAIELMPVDWRKHLPEVASEWESLIECWTNRTEPEPVPSQYECRSCPILLSCDLGRKSAEGEKANAGL